MFVHVGVKLLMKFPTEKYFWGQQATLEILLYTVIIL